MAEEKRKLISETLIAEIGAGKFAGRFPNERALMPSSPATTIWASNFSKRFAGLA